MFAEVAAVLPWIKDHIGTTCQCDYPWGKKDGECDRGNNIYGCDFDGGDCCVEEGFGRKCCHDIGDDRECQNWKKQGFCSDSKWGNYMIKNCWKSCTGCSP